MRHGDRFGWVKIGPDRGRRGHNKAGKVGIAVVREDNDMAKAVRVRDT